MGCDIHTYVEYSDFDDQYGNPYWKNFTVNGGSRNYVMFGVLAGVRVPSVQLFEPKGMPEGPLAYMTNDGYWLSVAPEAHPDWADWDGYTSIERAESWLKYGSVAEYRDGRISRVSHPDWHSHSWLTTDELAQALDHYPIAFAQNWPDKDAKAPGEWIAMLAAMRAFEENGCKTRLVFWFDN